MNDVSKAIQAILDKYEEDTIRDMVDDQVLKYVDDNWEEDGFESEYDWYCDHCNDEAESDILRNVIQEYQRENIVTLSVQDFSEVYDALKSEWDL